MKKTITRQVFSDAKALLDQGKTQAKVAKKLKIGTGTVSKIKNSKTYHAYCKKKSALYAFDEAVKKVSQPSKKIDMTDLDRNFALDKKVKKLQVEVKKNPAFAKFVEGQVALVVDEKVAKAVADKTAEAKRNFEILSGLTVEKDNLVLQMADLTKEVTYKEKVYAQVESTAKSLSKIVAPVGVLIGFIWISWLLVTHFR